MLYDNETGELISSAAYANPKYWIGDKYMYLIAAPTYHEVVDWLEGKGICIEVRMAYQFREKKMSWCGYVYVVEDEDYETFRLADCCSTREQALNAGILEALEMI